MNHGIDIERAAKRAEAAYEAAGWPCSIASLEDTRRTIRGLIASVDDLRRREPDEDFVFASTAGIWVQFNRWPEEGDTEGEYHVFFTLASSYDEALV